jgi:hypothetical protein
MEIYYLFAMPCQRAARRTGSILIFDIGAAAGFCKIFLQRASRPPLKRGRCRRTPFPSSPRGGGRAGVCQLRVLKFGDARPTPRPVSLLSSQFANPVCFPCFAAVGRERLFHPRRFRRDIQPDKAHQDRAPLILFLIVELAAITGKLTNNWR